MNLSACLCMVVNGIVTLFTRWDLHAAHPLRDRAPLGMLSLADG
jgi:hypothetical protein